MVQGEGREEQHPPQQSRASVHAWITWGLARLDSGSTALGQGSRICVPKTCPGGARAAAPSATIWEARLNPTVSAF